MVLNQLKNKKIGILGLGIENYALVKYLRKTSIPCEITVCDQRSEKELGEKYTELIQRFSAQGGSFSGGKDSKTQRLFWSLGKNYNKDLHKFDILFRSPGMPLFDRGIMGAINRKQKTENRKQVDKFVSSPMKLFFDLCPTKNIIGVTGTKGKGTTSSLIYEILKTAGKKVYLGGNIGVAPFEFMDKLSKDDWVVLELSSFQLEDMQKSPKIAVITNFYKEHLAPADPNNPNYHKSAQSYWQAKSNIFKHQNKSGRLVLNLALLKKTNKHKQLIRDLNLYTFHSYDNSASSFFIDNGYLHLLGSSFAISTSLPGEHNLENIAAAALAARFAGARIVDIQRAISGFKGLEHRLEKVAEISGITYYNDSFATTPESTITALRSFDAPIILLAGGAEKNSDFRKLAREIKKRVRFLVLLDGLATPRLKKEMVKLKFPAGNMETVYDIKDAVGLAKSKAQKGDIILLSTACASFGMFKNYKERGILFKKEVLRGDSRQ